MDFEIKKRFKLYILRVKSLLRKSNKSEIIQIKLLGTETRTSTLLYRNASRRASTSSRKSYKKLS